MVAAQEWPIWRGRREEYGKLAADEHDARAAGRDGRPVGRSAALICVKSAPSHYAARKLEPSPEPPEKFQSGRSEWWLWFQFS